MDYGPSNGWFNAKTVIGVSAVVVVIVLAVVLPIVLIKPKCGGKAKPTSGAVFDQCGGSSPTGSITCVDGKWSCDCGGTQVSNSSCTTDPANPYGYCAKQSDGSLSVECGCGGAAFETPSWCKGSKFAGACYDDGSLGSPGCACGDVVSAKAPDGACPVIGGKYACGERPDGTTAPDCVCGSGSSLIDVVGDFGKPGWAHCKKCSKKPKTQQDAVACLKASGCSCACTTAGFACSPTAK